MILTDKLASLKGRYFKISNRSKTSSKTINFTNFSKRPNLILPCFDHLDGEADGVDLVVVGGVWKVGDLVEEMVLSWALPLDER